MQRFISAMLGVMLCANTWALEAPTPQRKRVTLEPFTALSVAIVPDLGTRFRFPFVLDAAEDPIPFTLTVTNDAVFHVERPAGRDFFIVTVPPPKDGGAMPGYLGTLFVNLAGYHLTVALSTTGRLDQHYTDIDFELGEEKKADWLHDALARERAMLQAQFDAKQAAFEIEVERAAMVRLAQALRDAPSRKAIKEERLVRLDTGVDLTVYVERELDLGDYTAWLFELEQRGAPEGVRVEHVQLQAGESSLRRMIPATVELPKTVSGTQPVRGVVVVPRDAVPPGEYLTLQVATDSGNAEVTW